MCSFQVLLAKNIISSSTITNSKKFPKGTAPQEKVMQKIIKIIILIIDVIDKSLRAIDIVKQKRIIVVL
ncbi:hypothetical protein DLS61_04325 [Staphylococcus pseudintermedius]|nr:hypothetical protein DLS61_04325 [Staphylococcus pseudintermedius]